MQHSFFTPNYIVIGAITPDATGGYIEVGVYGGRSYYTNETVSWFIWWDAPAESWILSDILGSRENPYFNNIEQEIEYTYVPENGASGIATVVAA